MIAFSAFGAAPAHAADELLEAARKAVKDQRYCVARDLYVVLHSREGSAKYVYNAAESAYAADDKVSALALYQDLLAQEPNFERSANAKKRVEDLMASLGRGAIGKPCPPREPRCGDFIKDGGEQCDDGNLASADGCDSNCTVTRCGNGIITSPERCDDANFDDEDGCDSQCRVVEQVEVPEPEPEPEPEAEPEPDDHELVEQQPPVTATLMHTEPAVVPWVLTAAGAGAALVGGAVAVVGAAPWLAMNAENDKLRALRTEMAANPPNRAELFAQSIDVQGDAERERGAWNSFGQWLWLGGASGAAVGLGAAGVGLALLFVTPGVSE